MNCNPTIIVYSHTDYMDILKIQSDYVSKYNNKKILLINSDPPKNLKSIFDKYDEIIFYAGHNCYAARLLECIKKINLDQFLLIHDIDILLDFNSSHISYLNSLMSELDIDRLDLKHTNNVRSNEYFCLYEKSVNRSQDLPDCNLFLIKQNDPNEYIYNVNPSIWKKKTLIEILETFYDRSYRNIENMDVQLFCTKYKIYKFHQKSYIKCGYFECTDLFKFLHISHNGKILSLNKEFKTEFNQSYSDVNKEFLEIIDKYSLKNSEKWKQ